MNAGRVGLIALHFELRKLSIKPVSRMRFQFDPFHHEVQSIRDFLFHLSSKRVRSTSDKCTFKTDIVNDRSEPIINVTFDNGTEVTFKTANLAVVEIARELNSLVGRFTVEEEIPASTLKGAAKGGVRKRK